jgi:chemotaxis protein CheD
VKADAWRTGAPVFASPRPPGEAPRPSAAQGPVAAVGSGSAARHVVGIGEFAVASGRDDVVVTHALGSCIAVCIWDPSTLVAGLLHLLLPDSRINPQRAREQPAAFADTGIPLLFQSAYSRGLQKNRCLVRLVGGAEVAGSGATFDIGKRNILAAKNILWRNGVLIKGEDVGGKAVRTVNFFAADGRVQISSGREQVNQL